MIDWTIDHFGILWNGEAPASIESKRFTPFDDGLTLRLAVRVEVDEAAQKVMLADLIVVVLTPTASTRCLFVKSSSTVAGSQFSAKPICEYFCLYLPLSKMKIFIF